MKTIIKNKDISSVFVVTAAVLAIPLVAMQFSSEWDWKLFDFVIIGSLLIVTGLLIVLAKTKIKNIKYRWAAIIALLVVLFLTYVHLAVGIVDSWPLAGS